MHGRREPAVRIRGEADAAGEVGRRAAVGVHRRARHGAEPRGGLGLEQLRAAVDGVDRLPRRAIARVRLHERAVGGAERLEVRAGFVEQRHAPRYPDMSNSRTG